MFDPYHKWLGIPPQEQPPNHYRLLGISLFEVDPDVIDTAANRQMVYLQSCANGPHASLSQRLLNEVAAARLCLLNSGKKASYDAALKKQISSAKTRPSQSSNTTREVSKSNPVIKAIKRSPEEGTEARPNLPDRRQDRPGRPSESKVKGRARPPLEPRVLEANDVLGLRTANPGRSRPWRSVRMPVFAAAFLVGTMGVAALFAWRHRPGLRDRERHDLEAPSQVVASNDAPSADEKPDVNPLTSSQEVASNRLASPGDKPKTEGRPAFVIDAQIGKLAEGLGTDKLTPQVKWDPPTFVEYPKSNFTPLFNGRTIDAPLTDMSNCWMEEKFTDFVLRFEYRLRSHEDQPWTGIRLRHGGSARLSLVLSEGKSGGLLVDQVIPELDKVLIVQPLNDLNRIVIPALDAERPFGEWNDCQVVCKGTETTVSINRQVVNHILKGPSGTGMVCLAGFENGVAFRDIRIMSLGSPTPARIGETSQDGPRLRDFDQTFRFDRLEGLDSIEEKSVRYRVRRDTGIEFLPGKSGEPESRAVLRGRFTYPLLVEFDVNARSDGLHDIWPNLFGSLRFRWGIFYNAKTFVGMGNQTIEIPHVNLVPGKRYKIAMQVDEGRIFTISVDGKERFRRRVPAEVRLEGPIVLEGGIGHVVYRSVHIKGKLIAD